VLAVALCSAALDIISVSAFELLWFCGVDIRGDY
jgi:hypothetical protein